MKNALDRQTLIFTVAIFLRSQNEDTFSKNSNENARDLGTPGFSDIFDFAVCGGVFLACVLSGSIFYHFPSFCSEVSLYT